MPASPADTPPLHHASALGHVEMVSLLLESGANPALNCEWKKTPVDYALERNHATVANMLRECRPLALGIVPK